jgi:hypothetical protein
MKYFTATFTLIFMFIATAIVCGLIMNLLFPPAHDTFLAGVGLGWRNLPGTILGLFAAIHSAKVSLRKGSQREARLQKGT